MHCYSVRDQYVDNKSSRLVAPKSNIGDGSLFVTIIHNPHLHALKRKATAIRMIPGLIQPITSTLCKELILYIPPVVNQIRALDEVVLGY